MIFLNLKYTILSCLSLILLTCGGGGGSFSDFGDTSGSGVAGSYARFMTVDDFLYVIDNANIRTYSLADATLPALVNDQVIGERIESIYHAGGKLFIGAGSGLYIYDINSNGVPVFASTYSYDNIAVQPCDPVVAQGNYAYVTLSSDFDAGCGRVRSVNRLYIFDVTDTRSPKLVSDHNMIKPKGLGIDGDVLFVCDDWAGLKVFDVSDKEDISLVHHFSGFTTYDVIPLGGLLLVVGPENVYQYDYTDLQNMRLLSTIPIKA